MADKFEGMRQRRALMDKLNAAKVYQGSAAQRAARKQVLLFLPSPPPCLSHAEHLSSDPGFRTPPWSQTKLLRAKEHAANLMLLADEADREVAEEARKLGDMHRLLPSGEPAAATFDDRVAQRRLWLDKSRLALEVRGLLRDPSPASRGPTSARRLERTDRIGHEDQAQRVDNALYGRRERQREGGVMTFPSTLNFK